MVANGIKLFKPQPMVPVTKPDAEAAKDQRTTMPMLHGQIGDKDAKHPGALRMMSIK